MVDFEQVRAHRREQGGRLFTGRQQVVEMLERQPALAGRGGVEGFPDRLDASAPHQLGDIAAFDLLRVTRIHGQLFNLGRKQPRLRPDQLDQKTSTIGGS